MKTHTFTLLFGCFAATVFVSDAFTLYEKSLATPANVIDIVQPRQPKLSDIKNGFTFGVSTAVFEATDGYKSPEVTLNGVKWKITAKKWTKGTAPDTKDFLGFYLEAIFEENKPKWTCEAQANFRVYKNDNTVYNKEMTKQVFSSATARFGVEEFLEWSDFTGNYVTDGAAKFEVEITVGTPSPVIEFDQISSHLYVRLNNVNDVNSVSSDVVVRGVKWHVEAKKKTDDYAVFLYANPDDMDRKKSWPVKGTIKLLSSTDAETVTKNFQHNFRWNAINWGFPQLIKWTDLIDSKKGYVVNNAATLEIEFYVSSPTA